MRLIASVILASALSAVAQGTIRFDNNIPGSLVTHVYYSYDWRWKGGNGPNDTPPGTEDYSSMSLAAGGGFSAQLFAVPGIAVSSSSLEPASPVTMLGTGAQAGFVIPMIAELAGVPADSPVATLQLRVWDNEGGRVTEWGDSPGGESPMFIVHDIGGPNNPPPYLVGLQSFAVHQPIPEPSSVSLLGLGAVALLFQRRRRESRK